MKELGRRLRWRMSRRVSPRQVSRRCGEFSEKLAHSTDGNVHLRQEGNDFRRSLQVIVAGDDDVGLGALPPRHGYLELDGLWPLTLRNAGT